jgi:hypothetical protein
VALAKVTSFLQLAPADGEFHDDVARGDELDLGLERDRSRMSRVMVRT